MIQCNQGPEWETEKRQHKQSQRFLRYTKMFKKEKTIRKVFLKVSALLKAIVWELCLWIFSSVFSFCKMKGHYWWKYETTHDVSGVSVVEKITKSTISHNVSKWRHRYCFFFFLALFCFSCQVWLLVQVSCQYFYWF